MREQKSKINKHLFCQLVPTTKPSPKGLGFVVGGAIPSSNRAFLRPLGRKKTDSHSPLGDRRAACVARHSPGGERANICATR